MKRKRRHKQQIYGRIGMEKTIRCSEHQVLHVHLILMSSNGNFTQCSTRGMRTGSRDKMIGMTAVSSNFDEDADADPSHFSSA